MRLIVEELDDPTLAYATEKTDRLVSKETMEQMPPEAIEEWEAACEEFEDMSPDEQGARIEKVLTTYPAMDDLPNPDGYNEIH